jgi:hypothetical protein
VKVMKLGIERCDKEEADFMYDMFSNTVFSIFHMFASNNYEINT